MLHDILVQGIGAIGVVLSMLVYQQKTRRNLLICKLSGDVFFVVHYLLLSAYSGAIISTIAILRSLVFMNEDRKWAKKSIWVPIFITIAIVSGCLTAKNWFSVLPIIASVTAILSFAQQKPSVTRILFFPISACMITYDFFCGSYSGILNEILAFISCIIGILRHDKKKA